MTNHQYLIELCKEYNLPLTFCLYDSMSGVYMSYFPDAAIKLPRHLLNSSHSYWSIGQTSIPAPSIPAHSFPSLHSLILSCALPT